jgi:hypothetical protein
MADYPGANSSSTMQGNTKEVYSSPSKKKKFKKITQIVAPKDWINK